MKVRVALALVAAAAACALGALILGEYEFSGAMPVGAGVLFGLVVAEIVLGIGKARSLPIGVVCAAMVAGGLAWAAYVSSGEGLRPFPTGGWIAMALGALAVGIRTGRRDRTTSPTPAE